MPSTTQRQPLYRETAEARPADADDVVLAAGGIRMALGEPDQLGQLVLGE